MADVVALTRESVSKGGLGHGHTEPGKVSGFFGRVQLRSLATVARRFFEGPTQPKRKVHEPVCEVCDP